MLPGSKLQNEILCHVLGLHFGYIYGVGTLTPVVGNLNSEKYKNILDDNLWPVIAQHFPTSRYIFQEDNVPCHESRRTNQWKTENDIPTLEWSPQSPDLNIIENVRKL